MLCVLQKERLNETDLFTTQKHPKHTLIRIGRKIFSLLRLNILLI